MMDRPAGEIELTRHKLWRIYFMIDLGVQGDGFKLQSQQNGPNLPSKMELTSLFEVSPWITGMNFIINDLDFLIKRMELKIWKTLSVSCCHPRVTRVIDDLGHVFSAISQLFIIYTQCSCPLEYPLEDWQLSESEDRFSKWKVKHFHYMFTHFLLKGTFLSPVLSEVEILF